MKIRALMPVSRCLVLGSVLMATACQKDLKSSNNESSAAALSDSSTTADNVYSDGLTSSFNSYVDYVPDNVSKKHSGSTEVNSTETNGRPPFSCAIATVATTNGVFPVTVTLDYGAGCASADSIVRKGKVSYAYSGGFYEIGSTIAVTFDHYYVNNYGVQGMYSISNATTDSIPRFATQVTNGIFSYPDGTNFHYTSSKVVSMTTGFQTPFYFLDDVYSITGNSNFSSSEGNSVVSTVTSPLIKSILCPSISAGVISFVYNTSVKGTIDFGKGDCDNTADLKIGSSVKTIALR